jgi:hypothetical protein
MHGHVPHRGLEVPGTARIGVELDRDLAAVVDLAIAVGQPLVRERRLTLGKRQR